MIQEYSRYKVLKVFLDSPTHKFKIREIGRIINLAPTSIKNHIDILEKKKIIIKKKEMNYNTYTYYSNKDNPDFIFLQQQSIISELYYSNIINELWEYLAPKAIILYGSYAKGEATENSDIDLFIIGKEKNLDTSNYEKRLNKKLHINFSESFNNLSNELKNNIINGKILKGYLKVFK
ncbi:MAG: nucleotidyltransferase domain-containing protein [Nanoarchaeota archaeon]